MRNKAVRATIDTQGCYGRTALWYAGSEGLTEVVKMVVELGANPMLVDKYSRQPFGMTKAKDHAQCITLLKVSPRPKKQ